MKDTSNQGRALKRRVFPDSPDTFSYFLFDYKFNGLTSILPLEFWGDLPTPTMGTSRRPRRTSRVGSRARAASAAEGWAGGEQSGHVFSCEHRFEGSNGRVPEGGRALCSSVTWR